MKKTLNSKNKDKRINSIIVFFKSTFEYTKVFFYPILFVMSEISIIWKLFQHRKFNIISPRNEGKKQNTKCNIESKKNFLQQINYKKDRKKNKTNLNNQLDEIDKAKGLQTYNNIKEIIQKTFKLLLLIIICVIFKNAKKNTSIYIYTLIFQLLNIPNYLLILLEPCNFNFLLIIFNIHRTTKTGFYENMKFLIPQIIFINKNISFVLTSLSILIFRHIQLFLKSKSSYFYLNLSILISVSLFTVWNVENTLKLTETEKYVMDRAQILLQNSHGDQIEGFFDIIKVHEEIDTPEIIHEDSIEPIAANKVSKTDGKEDKKDLQESKKEEKNNEIQNNRKNESENLDPKKFKREPDSFLKHDDLIRLNHLPTSTYMVASEDEIDNKFKRIHFQGMNEPSFNLWRLVLPKNEKYLQAGKFFRLKNAHSGLFFGIRSDGILAISLESRKTRQMMLITKCNNHAYYKAFQDNDDKLKKANEKTRYFQKIPEYDFGLNLSIINFALFMTHLVLMLFNHVLHYRLNVSLLSDNHIYELTVFAGFQVFMRDTLLFKTSFSLILLKQFTNLLFVITN